MSEAEELDVLVVGAGFGGLYQLHYLRKLGYKVKIAEASGGLGGIWYLTTYPGARVDSEVPFYQYSDEELWRDWNFTERYPSRDEILDYFKYVDQKWDLSKDVYFNTRVVSATFDTATDKWHVHTRDGKKFVAKFFSLCAGLAAKPYEPMFKDMEKFRGVTHHSNCWPQEVDFRGKRVAVIGTGSSGVQVIQAIGPIVDHLTVFQRTPNLATPMHNPKYTAQEQTPHKDEYPDLFKGRVKSNGGYNYTFVNRKAIRDSPEVRQALYEELWSYGDFRFWLGGYKDSMIDKRVNDEMYAFWCKKVRARIHDPAMQDKLAPLTPPHPFGGKRVSLELSYFEVFNQPNVDLVDLKANPIECFTETGIRTQDGVNHEFDAIVLATGFDALTGALHQIDIKGCNGISLKDKWANGTRTYLGMTSAGFPNMFFVYNAHAPSGLSNGPTCIEIQGEWIVKCIDKMCKSGFSRMDVPEQVEARWVEVFRVIYAVTLFSQTDGWYNGANVPGKRREMLNFPGGVPMYYQECKEAEEKGYKGFVFTKNGECK